MRNGSIIREIIFLDHLNSSKCERNVARKKRYLITSREALWLSSTNYRNSMTHMVAPWYNVIYKLSNFVVAVVIRGVWSYDCGSGVYGTWLLGRLQSCSLSNAPFVFLYSSSTRSPEIRWRVAIVWDWPSYKSKTNSGIWLNTE